MSIRRMVQFFDIHYFILAVIIFQIKSTSSFPSEIIDENNSDFPTPEQLASFKLEEKTSSMESPDLENGVERLERPTCGTNETPYESELLRNGVISKDRLWKVFRYFIAEDFSTIHRRSVNVAVEILKQVLPCIKFEQLNKRLPDSEAYVTVVYSENCQSIIGNTGKHYSIEFNPNCLGYKRIKEILHEFCHSLGLNHEQNRPDRDEYVVVNFDNIIPDKKFAFNKADENEYSTFGIAYNKWSVVHYGLYDFSVNDKPTLSFKNSNKFAPNKPLKFGPFQNIGLQQTDVDKLRKMYGC